MLEVWLADFLPRATARRRHRKRYVHDRSDARLRGRYTGSERREEPSLLGGRSRGANRPAAALDHRRQRFDGFDGSRGTRARAKHSWITALDGYSQGAAHEGSAHRPRLPCGLEDSTPSPTSSSSSTQTSLRPIFYAFSPNSRRSHLGVASGVCYERGDDQSGDSGTARAPGSGARARLRGHASRRCCRSKSVWAGTPST